MATKEKTPIDVVLDKFVSYLKEQGKKSADQYRNVKNAFEVEEAFASAGSAEKNFLELLPKLLTNDENTDRIKEIIEKLERNVLVYSWNKNGKKSYRTYLCSFLNFIKKIDAKTKESIKEDCKNFNLNFSELDKEILSNNNIIYGHVNLIGIFKGRLNRQERTSGDKIWLPLDFIRKIFEANNRTEDYWAWIKELAGSIHIHYLDNKKVKNVQMQNNSASIKLVLDKYYLYRVWLVINEDGKEKSYPVLTPTGKGNEKEYMYISNANTLREIAIDHVKPIDKTLRDFENKYQQTLQLKKISEKFKYLKKTGQDKNKDEIKNAVAEIKNDVDFNLDALLEELKWIGGDSPLRLMASKYNSQKSNGNTFKKILKDSKKSSYWGIIEDKNVKCNKCGGDNMIIYQELDDIFREDIEFIVDEFSTKDGRKKVKDSELNNIINII